MSGLTVGELIERLQEFPDYYPVATRQVREPEFSEPFAVEAWADVVEQGTGLVVIGTEAP